jgi:hypothetical protein
MKAGAIVIGVIMLLVGAVWIGQGLGYIKGSFMTGNMLWFWIGCALVVAALLIGGFTLLRRGKARTDLPS